MGNNNRKYITVLLTTYNSAQYIEDCIFSILNQSYKNYEFLIIDDGSEDNTEEVIKSFSDDRIKYKKKSHVGRSKALNYGLQNAKYDWIALIDADDIAHPQRLEKEIQFTELGLNAIIFTKAFFFNNKNILFEFSNISNTNSFSRKLLLHSPIPHSSVLYNKNFILKFGGYNTKLFRAEDYDLWLRLRNDAKFVLVNENLLFCRYTKNSLSRKDEKLTNKVIYGIQNRYYSNIKSNFGITYLKEENKYRGWREYFYGDTRLARKYWRKNLTSFYDLRIILAFLVTLLPEPSFEKVKKYRIKLKIKYRIDSILLRNNDIKKRFINILESLNNNRF